MRIAITTLVFTTFWVINLSAQFSVDLDSFSVTANQIEKPILETGRSISVISAKEIERLPVQTVEELLRYTAGVNLNARNNFGVQTDIGIRGSTFSQVIVLLDNVRINGPLTGHFNNNIPVSLHEIAHIEVLKGSAAASFGADAVGGVIHIKTKTYVDDITEGNSISGNIGAGSNNSTFSDIGASSGNSRFVISGSVKTSISEGEQLENPNFLVGISEDSLFNNYFDVRSYSLASKAKINDQWQWYGRVSLDDRDFSAKYFYTRLSFDESTERVQSKWFQTSLMHRGVQSSNNLTLALATTRDKFIFNPLFASNENTTNQWSLIYNHQNIINSKLKYSVGSQIIYKDMESLDRGDRENLNYGLYMTADYAISNRWNLTATIRGEQDDNFGFEIIPQLSTAYQLKDWTIHASAGKSIRSGDFTERFIASQIDSLGAGRNVGNPDLEAERAWNYDLGFTYHGQSNLQWQGAAFYRTSSNLIDFGLTNQANISNLNNLRAGEDYFYANNVSESKTIGFETSLRYLQDIRSTDKLEVQIGYTYLNTTNNDDEVSKYLANHPGNNANYSISYSNDIIDMVLSGFFINRDTENAQSIAGEIKESYNIHNLKIQLRPFQKNMGLYLSVNNLFDTEYQEILGARLPGRWIIFGAQFNM